MRGPAPRVPLRRAIGRHVALAVAASVLVAALVTIGIALFARQDAYASAARVARQVGTALTVPLAEHDFVAPIDAADRADLSRDLAPFLASGMIRRFKVWTVEGDLARIAFSDEPRIEGMTSTLDPGTAARLARGEVLVGGVPDDDEHRYASDDAGSELEVFLAFRDAGGRESRLEVYVPVDQAATTVHTAATVLPIVLGGLLVVALATLPLSVAVARRMERERAEQRAIRRFGLDAAAASRQELARHLHDGVIPDLAGAGLLIEAARTGTGDPPDELLDHAHRLLIDEVRELRALLTDLVPARPVEDDLAAALREVVPRMAPGRVALPAVSVEVAAEVALPTGLATLLFQVACELLRNAVRHAGAEEVRVLVSATGGTVELLVVDDGVGFVPTDARTDGHVGLLLVGRVLADHGGRLEITSSPGVGTTAAASLPAP
jgi:two-component system NarL family sensor kinase